MSPCAALVGTPVLGPTLAQCVQSDLIALQDTGLAGHVVFIGFDASESLVRGLDAGHIDSLVVQDPFKMGYLGVQTMVRHLAGSPVERRVDTGVVLATRSVNPSRFPALAHPWFRDWYRLLAGSPRVHLTANSHVGAADYAACAVTRPLVETASLQRRR